MHLFVVLSILAGAVVLWGMFDHPNYTDPEDPDGELWWYVEDEFEEEGR